MVLILGFIFSQNQFFISGLSGDDLIRNRVLEALYCRVMRAYREKKTFRVIIVIPLLPGFQVVVLGNSDTRPFLAYYLSIHIFSPF